MGNPIKIGIIICERYKNCAGGKCFRSIKNREGAFERYKNQELEIVGYTSCGGCPGGNIEYAPEEMQKNNVDVIHFATGMVVGYPPCPYLEHFRRFIETKYNINVVIGTHPIPEKYFKIHQQLGTWENESWQAFIQPTITDEKTRKQYD